MSEFSRLGRILVLSGTSVVLGGAIFAATTPQPAAPPQADNTKMNKGDAQRNATTADQQKMNSADTETTRKIRAAVMEDKSLSTYAQNVKIITQDGKVTLKGPVRSQKEKTEIETKAASVAGATNITNELSIAPSK